MTFVYRATRRRRAHRAWRGRCPCPSCSPEEKQTPSWSNVTLWRLYISLYKILFHVKALLWERIILSLPPPTCKAYPIAILLNDYCAIYNPPTTPLVYAIPHTILAIAISCKGHLYIGWLDAVELIELGGVAARVHRVVLKKNRRQVKALYRALTWYCSPTRPFAAPDVPLLVTG